MDISLAPSRISPVAVCQFFPFTVAGAARALNSLPVSPRHYDETPVAARIVRASAAESNDAFGVDIGFAA